jgi:hypothetical protein
MHKFRFCKMKLSFQFSYANLNTVTMHGDGHTVGGQIKLGHLKFNLCKSDH